MSSNKKLILAFLLIISLMFLAACESDTSSVINQTEAETGAQQTISSLNNGTVDSLNQYLSDDFSFKSADDETPKGINSLKDKFFNSNDNNLNFKIDDNFSLVDSSEKEIIIASNLIVEINFSTGTKEITIPITLTFEKINGEWKISEWKEREVSNDQSDLEQEIKDAETVLDGFLAALESNSTDEFEEYLTEDFEYENELNDSEIEFEGRENFINYYNSLFVEKDLKHNTVSLTNKKFELDDEDDDDNEVEVYGLLTVSGEINGKEFTEKGYYAEFELVKTNNGWKIEEWEQEDDIDDDLDD